MSFTSFLQCVSSIDKFSQIEESWLELWVLSFMGFLKEIEFWKILCANIELLKERIIIYEDHVEIIIWDSNEIKRLFKECLWNISKLRLYWVWTKIFLYIVIYLTFKQVDSSIHLAHIFWLSLISILKSYTFI